MLFAPTRFTGFYVPGLKTLFPFLPRKLQILPIFAPGGILGFQGFVPARAEKMASFISDKALVKIGSPSDFYRSWTRTPSRRASPRPGVRSCGRWWTT